VDNLSAGQASLMIAARSGHRAYLHVLRVTDSSVLPVLARVVNRPQYMVAAPDATGAVIFAPLSRCPWCCLHYTGGGSHQTCI
jgi:hypothetical protein